MEVRVEFIDNVWMRLHCEAGPAQELSDKFKFKFKEYDFLPKSKKRFWDGYVRLFSTTTHKIYRGLYYEVAQFCKDNNYQLSGEEPNLTNFSVKECQDFVESLNLPFTPRWYQYKAFTDCVRNNRLFTLLPTSSGKTPLTYLLTRYYNEKTLILVPRLSLIHQTEQKFREYGFKEEIHTIFSGQERDTSAQVYISTWQSVYDLPRDWFNQFHVIIGDEGHRFKAKCLKKLMEKTVNIPYRFGMTGTLDGAEVNEMTLIGLFGRIKKYLSTKDMIDQGYATPLRIQCVELKYPEEVSKIVSGMTYQQEIKWLYANDARNKFIKNLALSLDGNIIILYNYVDKHGKILYNEIKNEADNVFFVAGEVSGEEREKIRKKIQTLEKSITIASLGTFSEGIDIPNLHNVILTAPTKAPITLLQSIGRVLRLHHSKQVCTVIDLSDNLIYRGKANYTAKHFIERMKLYIKEGFPTQRYPVEL